MTSYGGGPGCATMAKLFLYSNLMKKISSNHKCAFNATLSPWELSILKQGNHPYHPTMVQINIKGMPFPHISTVKCIHLHEQVQSVIWERASEQGKSIAYHHLLVIRIEFERRDPNH